jgi:uncharacterized membrane protein YfcA
MLGVSPVSSAMAYALFIVGVTAFYGGLSAIIRGKVNLRIVVIFAIPSFISTYLTRKFFVPALPEHWFSIGDMEIMKSNGLMFLFTLLMLISGIKMVRSSSRRESKEHHKLNYFIIMICGLSVGLLAGTVGAGGGFLIIPALVLFAGVEMKAAVNTCLVIIAINSLSGFAGDLQNHLHPDWGLLLSFSALAIAGIILGKFLSRKIEGAKLKTGFGVFVLLLAFVIIYKEILG